LKRTGIARLPLHYGKAPAWLTSRMQKLAKEMVKIIVDEYGTDEFMRRISDPFWFQAFGCVLGYDWHSSGVTTVVTGVLKKSIAPEELGIAVCGGKGRHSKQTLPEIEAVGEEFGLSTVTVKSLQRASKLSAKVDSAAIQAGYQLYHHAFFVTEKGKWAVMQQGMCPQDRTARRYHWLSDGIQSFVVEPHTAIVGDVARENALDMTAEESEGCRKTSVDIARESPKKTLQALPTRRSQLQRSLHEWLPQTGEDMRRQVPMEYLSMPVNINWKVLQRLYECQPRDYEELLSIRGVGPATVRGLALVAELIYGEKPSWRDPVKYSFAYGGKDGVPYPVDRRAMDESINILKQAIGEAGIGNNEKLHSLARLRRFVSEDVVRKS